MFVDIVFFNSLLDMIDPTDIFQAELKPPVEPVQRRHAAVAPRAESGRSPRAFGVTSSTSI